MDINQLSKKIENKKPEKSSRVPVDLNAVETHVLMTPTPGGIMQGIIVLSPD